MVPDLVGIVLRAGGGLVDHVLCAIRDDNADVELQVVDHGEHVHVWARGGVLRVNAATLGWHAGRPFGTAELRSMIVSCRGTLDLGDDRMTVISESRRTMSRERFSLRS
jgi:MmoB/DmpM family